jgi:hypothetical protein
MACAHPYPRGAPPGHSTGGTEIVGKSSMVIWRVRQVNNCCSCADVPVQFAVHNFVTNAEVRNIRISLDISHLISSHLRSRTGSSYCALHLVLWPRWRASVEK